MKIRNGFVSNSSSSSFVVAFPEEPKSVDDVKRLLFKDQEYYSHPYDRNAYSAWQVSATVFEDIKNQKPNNKKKIAEAFGGWIEGQPDLDNFRKGENYDWEAYEKACDKFQNKCSKKFIEKNLNTFIYTFHYGDSDGDYFGALEHGGLFDLLPHKRISCH